MITNHLICTDAQKSYVDKIAKFEWASWFIFCYNIVIYYFFSVIDKSGVSQEIESKGIVVLVEILKHYYRIEVIIDRIFFNMSVSKS